jgi:hypothetical protein
MESHVAKRARNALIGAGLALTASFASLALPGEAAAYPNCAGNPTLGSNDVGYQIRCGVNWYRHRYHRSALASNSPLNAAAHEYADNLAQGVSSPTPGSLAKSNGYCRSGTARLFTAVYRGTIPGWQNAITFWNRHRAIRNAILDRKAKDIGRRGVVANPPPHNGDTATFVMILGTCVP